MKQCNLRFTLLMFAGMIFITGCKKATCECVAYNSSIPEAGGKTTFTVSGSKKKQKQDCSSHSSQPDAYGNYTSCVLK